MNLVSCHFRLRTLVTDEPTYRYTDICISSPRGDGALLLDHPPLVGDLVLLIDQADVNSGTFRIIERSWMYSSWGSRYWPYGEAHSTAAPWLDLLVEPAEGLIRNEVPDEEVVPDA